MTLETRPTLRQRIGLTRTSSTLIGSTIALALVAMATFQGIDVLGQHGATTPPAAAASPDHVKVNIQDRVDADGILVGGKVYVPADAVDNVFDLEHKQTDDGYTMTNTLNKPVIFTAYDPKGDWLQGEKNDVEHWGDVRMDDATGLPKFLHGGKLDFLPITVAHYGLQYYSIWSLNHNDASAWAKTLKTADWFVANQNSDGGWPAKFDFEFQPGLTSTLKSGWYSGMSQGMGATLLARVYAQTKDAKYRTAALKALNPLTVPVADGGVQRTFDGKYQWWEEYPTKNYPTYVLNGFIYCLLGVYDVWQLLGDTKAGQLYNSGLASLLRMINLYDLGSHTSYDLLHYSIPGIPPNIARWGYHNLHVSQLSVLNIITNGQFKDLQARWLGYVPGVSAPHN